MFTHENTDCPSIVAPNEPTNDLSNINISKLDVTNALKTLKVNKAPGPDMLYARTLIELKDIICDPLSVLFNKSLACGLVPSDWKMANVTPIFKKGSKVKPENYRPISLTSIVGKLMETIIKKALISHMDKFNLIKSSQHGFRAKKSCLTNLLDFYDRVVNHYDNHRAVDIVLLDLQKAFDKVPHKRLLGKLQSLGIRGNIYNWVENWLAERTQRVVINGVSSKWKPVSSGVPQGSVLGPVLFNCYINDIDDGIDSYISKFADDTKLTIPASNIEDTVILQNDLNKISNWAEKWLMTFNTKKCKIIHIGNKNINYDYTMYGETLSVVSSEKDLGVIVDNHFKGSEQCTGAVKRANSLLGLIARTFDFKNEKIIITLYRSLVRPHLEYCSPVWSPHLRKYIDKLERVQRRATKMIPSLRQLPYEERLKRLKLTSLEDRRLRTDMLVLYKILNNIDKIDYHDYLNLSNSCTRGNEYKLKKRTTNCDTSKYWFFSRVIGAWNNLPAHIVNWNSVGAFTKRLDEYMKNNKLVCFVTA